MRTLNKILMCALFWLTITELSSQDNANQDSLYQTNIEVKVRCLSDKSPDVFLVEVYVSELDEEGLKVKDKQEVLLDYFNEQGITLRDISYNFNTSFIGEANWEETIRSETRTYYVELESMEQILRIYTDLSTFGVRSARITKVDYRNREEVRDELRTCSIVKARKKAEQVAKNMGRELGDLLVLNEHSNIKEEEEVQIFQSLIGGRRKFSSYSSFMTTGQDEYRVGWSEVNAVYELK